MTEPTDMEPLDVGAMNGNELYLFRRASLTPTDLFPINAELESRLACSLEGKPFGSPLLTEAQWAAVDPGEREAAEAPGSYSLNESFVWSSAWDACRGHFKRALRGEG